ncbi:hypothetical protein TOK_5566 [Pseudonocardia sp. N23]|nr:hypothetical protein TOK_5566 [Pseudonocardia sp. N23]
MRARTPLAFVPSEYRRSSLATEGVVAPQCTNGWHHRGRNPLLPGTSRSVPRCP